LFTASGDHFVQVPILPKCYKYWFTNICNFLYF
jgi:hypothetical protein